MKGAVIFDRGGILNADVGYPHRPERIRWIEGAESAVRMANEAGLLTFVATDQSGIGGGMFTEAGNLYKISKNWKAAGDAFMEAGEAELKRDNRHEAASKFIDAANCYKKIDNNGARCVAAGGSDGRSVCGVDDAGGGPVLGDGPLRHCGQAPADRVRDLREGRCRH